MRGRLILNWICLPVEPPKSGHYILISLSLSLGHASLRISCQGARGVRVEFLVLPSRDLAI